MKRLIGGVTVAFVLMAGLIIVAPAPVAAQGPSTCAAACREAFVTCISQARSGDDAAVCRAAAVACLKACVAD